MDSKAKIAGRPLHPMLIAFPVTLYTVTVVSVVAYALGGSPYWWRVSLWANAAAVVSALVAAVPGLVDLTLAIPRGSPAKRLGLAHMTLNLGALALFAANVVVQRGSWAELSASTREALRLGPLVAPDLSAAVALTAVGYVALLGAGILGATLVQRHHVGVHDDAGTPLPPAQPSPR